MIDKSLLVAVAVVLVSLSSTTVTGSGCPGAHRNMAMEAACREATAGKPMSMYKLCTGTLGRRTPAGSIHEASEYAFIAAAEAALEYTLTMSWVKNALGNASIPVEDKAAYDQCGRSYREAAAAMDRTMRRLDRVMKRLPERCGLDLGAEYRVALRGVRACRDDHLAKVSDSQLRGMAKDDYDRTQSWDNYSWLKKSVGGTQISSASANDLVSSNVSHL